MTSFKYGGLRNVGALTIRADGFKNLRRLRQLGHWGTSNLQPTDWPFCQRVKLQTQHSLANRSGIFLFRPCWVSGATEDKTASLVTTLVGGNKGIIIVARPVRLPFIPKALCPPSGRASFQILMFKFRRLYFSASSSASAFAPAVFQFILIFRRRIIPFSVGGKSAGRQGKESRK